MVRDAVRALRRVKQNCQIYSLASVYDMSLGGGAGSKFKWGLVKSICRMVTPALLHALRLTSSPSINSLGTRDLSFQDSILSSLSLYRRSSLAIIKQAFFTFIPIPEIFLPRLHFPAQI